MASYADHCYRCIITGAFGADLHHLVSRGAGGSDSVHNLLPLSHKHHVEVHSLGLTTFSRKYPIITEWLENHDWEYDKKRDKWMPPCACRK